MNKKTQEIIPSQEEGASTDTRHSVELDTDEQAKSHFQVAKKRLLDVSHWHELCGAASAVFKLTDEQGNEVLRMAKEKDHFKINIPAPGTESGEGFDWVQIESIIEVEPSPSEESVAIRVRPSENPNTPEKEIAHFFKDDATSTFIVKRVNKQVIAEVHGRNELPNTENSSLADKVRNTVVALGAMLGFSTPQWKSLVKGLVDLEN